MFLRNYKNKYREALNNIMQYKMSNITFIIFLCSKTYCVLKRNGDEFFHDFFSVEPPQIRPESMRRDLFSLVSCE